MLVNDEKPTEFDVFITDFNGNLRGKRFPAKSMEEIMHEGMKLPVSVVALDNWGNDVLKNGLVFETGDSDGLCLPVQNQAVPVPWAAQPRKQILAMIHKPDGSPCHLDPRQILKNIVDRYKKLGLTPVVATELEFYLLDRESETSQRPIPPVVRNGNGRRLQETDCYSVKEMDGLAVFFADVREACNQQNIPADTIISELGPGQFEINMVHTDDALLAADHASMFKRLISGVARKHGMASTFMAKPYPNESGNGMHVHFSVIDEDGKNVFDNGTDEGSALLKQAVAGLLNHMADSMLIFAPHLNSYRRFQAGAYTPTFAGWGYGNRTVAVRIPESSNAARRIEHRVSGADANPYLVLAAVLGAALNGIENKMSPPKPIEGNAYTLVDLYESLPSRWDDATEFFKDSQFLNDYLGKDFVNAFSAAKEQEQNRLFGQISDIEYKSYL
ncbi:Gamma-glutamylputrescine synthetase PuuA [Marinomonas spartinae]|uniref:glutamine synthetase family protein n=1 Tax=Marinomonas spartinae TaxID=1792290 RepID=UPI0008091076|nr:glutamine synthetase family protein [Marinomonas spartinae]SBS30443.1 Gamma-glutamylputrescine synthetase PuuA [Marinomonas spartinae]